MGKEGQLLTRRQFLVWLGVTLWAVACGRRPSEETPSPTTSWETPTPTEVKPTSTLTPESTSTRIPLPEVISKETAQFVLWSPQQVHQAIAEAFQRGKRKTAINFDIKKGGEIKKVFSPMLNQELLGIFLPEGETFTFYAPLGGEVYAASPTPNPKGNLSVIDIKAGDYRIQFGFPTNGEVLFKGGARVNAGDAIFRAQFLPGSGEQAKFEKQVGVKGIVVIVGFAIPGKTGYAYLQPEQFLTNEQGEVVILSPRVGTK